MIPINISELKVTELVDVFCDDCNKLQNKTIKNIKAQRKRMVADLCRSCSALRSLDKKPQCSKKYWTEEKKIEHGESVRNSEVYYESIKNRPDNSGINNPMFGKEHSDDTKHKMSISRTGKVGENATAWKGGKTSLVRRIKGFQHRNGWYLNVYKKDGFKCVKCLKSSSDTKIDAHHIIPIKEIVDKHKDNFGKESELYKHLISLDIIKDNNQDNGETLCRECHREVHLNWGSHYPKVN